MTNNAILKRLRYILKFNDKQMLAVFNHCDVTIVPSRLQQWCLKEEDPDYLNCPDLQLAQFLNGLIIEKRGKQDGPTPKPEKNLNNNLILKKLKIAFSLKAEEILAILAKADFKLSKHELSAFFRHAEHKHFRQCKDQVLRNFLMGLQIHIIGPNKRKQNSPWQRAKQH